MRLGFFVSSILTLEAMISFSTSEIEQTLAKLDPLFDEAGVIPVSKEKKSGLWYGFYEAANKNSDSPIILWLNGGPGCSSAKGSIYELGPRLVTKKHELVDNPHSYNAENGLLIVDQPIGTGLSPVGTDTFRKGVWDSSIDFFRVLQKFFAERPHLARRPLVLAGESYAGKYIPAFTHLYHQIKGGSELTQQLPEQPLDETTGLPWLPSDLRGLKPSFNLVASAIGNGYIEPIPQLEAFVESSRTMGLAPLPVIESRVVPLLKKAKRHAEKGRWMSGMSARADLFDIYQQEYGIPTLLNPFRNRNYDHLKTAEKYFNRPEKEVRQMWGAPTVEEVHFVGCNRNVTNAYLGDIMRPMGGILTETIKKAKHPYLLFNGSMDPKDGTYSHWKWLQNFANDPDAIDHILNATQTAWKATFNDGQSPAYAGLTSVGKDGLLTFTSITGAGHMVPVEYPEAAQQLIQGWVRAVTTGNRTLALQGVKVVDAKQMYDDEEDDEEEESVSFAEDSEDLSHYLRRQGQETEIRF